jgi:hypothetical protein
MKYFPGVLIITMVLLASMSSCRSVKTIQTAIAKKDTIPAVPVTVPRFDSMALVKEVLDTLHKNHIDFQTFTAKMKVHYESSGDGKKYDFVANMQMKKDSAIWINIEGLLGIDLMRALITPDSVKLLNKVDNTVNLWSIEYLQGLLHLPMTFTHLQNVLIGNPVYLDSNFTSYVKDDRSLSLVGIGGIFKYFLTVSKENYTLQHSKLDDVDAARARTAEISYGNYEFSKNGFRFATYRRITTSERSKLDIELDYKQFEFNKPVSLSFRIPRNYRRL